MDDHYRTRIKIGAHELEAEGPTAVVQEQVKRFLELISTLPPEQVSPPSISLIDTKQTANDTTAAASSGAPQSTGIGIPAIDVKLDKIMRLEDRVVSLTVRADNAATAVLLLLYGQRMLRQNDAVTGGEIMEGVTNTGGLEVARVDRLLEKLGRDGDVIVIGERRSKRYRLTNTGLNKAREAAKQLLSIVA